MSQKQGTKLAAGLACAALVVAFAGPTALAQKPADVAAKFTGTWKLNHDLSPGLAPMRGGAPGVRGGGGGQRGGGPAAGNIAFAIAAKPMLGQGGRGGAGGGGGDLAAIRSFQGMPDTMTITASADSVTFKDDIRGERVFAVTDKNVKMTIQGAQVTVKFKWDKNSLKQDVSVGESNLSGSWTVNDAGTRLTGDFKLADMSSQDARFTQVKAVYDKQ